MAYQVRDPSDDGNAWHDVDASDAREAALQFLRDHDYDERDFDPDRPFGLLVRDDRLTMTVKVRVVPARFEVA